MSEDLDWANTLQQLVDGLLPDLTPYETSVYLLLLRLSWLDGPRADVRIGKKAIANRLGTATRGTKGNFNQIGKVLRGLEAKSCVVVGDTTREGTLYQVRLPKDVPSVAGKLSSGSGPAVGDWFRDPDKRQVLFERDRWCCRYCGDAVTGETATLDHYIPQKDAGPSDPENLRTACLMCNSIKSGKALAEAAPLLLDAVRRRGERRRDSTDA